MYRLRIFPAADIWSDWAPDAGATGRGNRPAGGVPRLDLPAPRPGDGGRAVQAVGGSGRSVLKWPRYFRCRLQLDSPEQTVEVYTEHVPEAWQKGARPDAPGGAMGVFLKLGGRPAGATAGLSSSAGVTAIFAAPRLAWYPDDLSGRLGMDVGLLDTVQDQKELTGGEQEAFYQMLAAAGRAEPDELLRQAEAALPNSPEKCRWTDPDGKEFYSVVPLFEEPAAHRGELLFFQGTAREIKEVRVDDPAIAARFGFDHYYQVSLFTGDCEFKLAPSKSCSPTR